MHLAIIFLVTASVFTGAVINDFGHVPAIERLHVYPEHDRRKLNKMFLDAARMSRLHALCKGRWKVSHKALCSADAVRGR
jgi:hypothetical protein